MKRYDGVHLPSMQGMIIIPLIFIHLVTFSAVTFAMTDDRLSPVMPGSYEQRVKAVPLTESSTPVESESCFL